MGKKLAEAVQYVNVNHFRKSEYYFKWRELVKLYKRMMVHEMQEVNIVTAGNLDITCWTLLAESWNAKFMESH